MKLSIFAPRRFALAQWRRSVLGAALTLCGFAALSVVPAAAGEQARAIPTLAEAQRVAPQAITDDRGASVQLAAPPRRIVSLLPSLTESVCALGLCDRLVGVDRYSSWPDSVHKLPVVGGGIDPNVEAIVALKPDLVLLSNASKVAQRLEALGIKVAALEVRSQVGVHKVLGKLEKLLGVPPTRGAEQVWSQLQQGLAAAAASMPAYAKGKRVYFEVSRGPYAAGPQSFIGEILSQLGVANVVPPELGPFPRLSPEFLLRAQPEVILMSSRSMQVATSYPGWNSLQAVRGGKLCVFNEAESNIIVRPGPRMAEAAQLIATCLARIAPRTTEPASVATTAKPGAGVPP